MKTSVRPASTGPEGEAAVPAEASAFAALVTSSPREQALVAEDLARFPPEIFVRGVFYVGLAEAVLRAKGPAALAEVQRAAGAPEHAVAFRQYPHRDWYRFYYAAAHAMHPGVPLPNALRLVSRGFYRIWRESLLGKTMSALMGTEPRTLLMLLPKAYNLTVVGNHHAVEAAGERAVLWRARAEAVAWYEETFRGIIEGTTLAGPLRAADGSDDGRSKPPWWQRPSEPAPMSVEVISRAVDGGFADYVFRITW